MTPLLGLDISTSVVGIAIVDVDIPIDTSGSRNHIIALKHIDFKKQKTLWEKADHVADVFAELSKQYTIFHICVEEAAMMYTPGMSSAATITSLIRFNGLCTYIARNIFNTEPVYITAAHARKLCGLKMQQKKKVGKGHKDQVFAAINASDLQGYPWPLKKSGNAVVDYAKDIVDSYVIAKAGYTLLKG